VRNDHADLALKQLEKLIGRDPMLRDILNPSMPSARRASRFEPAVDVLESEAGWVLLLDVPGVPRSQIRIRLDGTRLVVSGERPSGHEGATSRVHERPAGHFQREFLLPFQVRGDAIRARLDQGVLRVDLPRNGPDEARDIEVEGGPDDPDARFA
jgi:HSP20 family protein